MFSSHMKFCINLWNVAGALHSSNDMCSHSKNPMFPRKKQCTALKPHPLLSAKNQPSLHIQAGEVSCTNLILNGFLYLGEWMGVFLGSHI